MRTQQQPRGDHRWQTTSIRSARSSATSTEGIDDAIRGAVGRAAKTLHNLDWFEVVGIRGHIEDNRLSHFQVTLKVGFRLDEPES